MVLFHMDVEAMIGQFLTNKLWRLERHGTQVEQVLAAQSEKKKDLPAVSRSPASIARDTRPPTPDFHGPLFCQFTRSSGCCPMQTLQS